MNDDDLRRELREAPVPESDQAEDRAWRVVRAAYEDRRAETGEDRPLRRFGSSSRPARRLGLAAVALLGAAILVISPAGAEVREWVSDAVGGDAKPREVLTSPPGGGKLLVDDSRGSWVVNDDGSRRWLGDFEDLTWSPRGLFVAAVDGNQLIALEPDGDVRWTLARPTTPSLPSWNSPDGYRIAYIDRSGLRVVAGDGSGDRIVARGVTAVRPAWRPGPDHLLAYAQTGGRVRVIDADGDPAPIFTTGPGPDVEGLEWSHDGSALLVWTRKTVELIRPNGKSVWRYRSPGISPIGAATIAPTAPLRVAILESGPNGLTTLAGPDLPRIVLFSAPGRIEDPVWSPDGAWLTVAWPATDQWVFLRSDGRPSVRTFTGISEQFAPGAIGAGAFPRIAGWCCSPGT